jgi:hypothetical protein
VLRQRASHAIQRCCVVLPYSLRAPSPAPCATTSAIIRVLPISLSAAAASVLVSSLAAPHEQPRGVVRAEGGARPRRIAICPRARRISRSRMRRSCGGGRGRAAGGAQSKQPKKKHALQR